MFLAELRARLRAEFRARLKVWLEAEIRARLKTESTVQKSGLMVLGRT